MRHSDYPKPIVDRLLELAAQVLAVDDIRLLMEDEDDPGRVVAVARHAPGGAAAEGGPEGDLDVVNQVMASGAAVAAPACSVPVAWAGRVRGAVCAPSPDPERRFEQREVDALATLGRVMASALEHADMGAQLEPGMRLRVETMGAAMQDRIEASADVIDMRDGYAPGRRRRVARLARDVGQRLGMSPGELDELEAAARLHNAGKSKLPDAVLGKEGPLADEERELIAFHPEWGAELLARVPRLGVVAALVLFHRERMDGTGYPYGIRGDRIPLASRIIGACDALDAMLSDRPYRMRLEPIAAEGELRAGSASYFDSEVIEAVLA